MTLRALIVDDESIARRRIRRLLAAEPDVVLAGECSDGAAAVHAITTDRPDLVLLDVQMPELDGFAVLRGIDAAAPPAIIFVTAFDRYALRAFDVHAIDYLLKPFARERFRSRSTVRAIASIAAGSMRDWHRSRPRSAASPAISRACRCAPAAESSWWIWQPSTG